MDSLLRRLLAATAMLTVAVLTLTAVVAAASSAAFSTAVPVLGSSAYLAPYGEGWGTAHPRSVYNGGDPAGSVDHLRWRHWGDATATARGLTPIFRPGGGYYARPGRIKFRAESLGQCPDGTYAYTRLEFRVSKKPGGSLGTEWQPWASDGEIC